MISIVLSIGDRRRRESISSKEFVVSSAKSDYHLMNNDNNNDNDNDNVRYFSNERTTYERTNERTTDRPTGRKTERPIQAGRYLDYLFHISELSPRVQKHVEGRR